MKDKSSKLVIVESPAKAKTIQRFLGEEYTVKSCYGHIRDLHEKQLGIDVENGFKPEYAIPDEKKKIVAELKKLADKFKEDSILQVGGDETTGLGYCSIKMKVK